MKKFLALVMGVAAALMLGAPQAVAYLGEGNDGDSARSAYVIDSVADLTLLRSRLASGMEPDGKHYRLGADIDISSEMGWIPIGTAEHPFNGHLHGDGRTIRVDIDRGGEDAGLFGTVGGSLGNAIRDLTVTGTVRGRRAGGIAVSLERMTIQGCTFNGTVEGDGRAGGIVATLGRDGSIDGCSFSDTVRASGASSAAGGIAGQNGYSVRRCTVSSGSTVSASGKWSAAGGIVGITGYETGVWGCVSHASIEDAAHRGGIVGVLEIRSGSIHDNTYTGADREIGHVSELELDDGPSTIEEISDVMCGPEGEGGLCDAGAGSLCLFALGGLMALMSAKRP